jgi:hypothetical protein
MKVILIDCNYVEPEFAGAYLIVHEFEGRRRGLFVECNTNAAIPYLVKAAAAEGLVPADIDGLVITHVHLDHAGGAGLFLKTFPAAKLYAHPRAARHAIDPAKLIAGAAAVYGAENMMRLYGEILPCDSGRVQILEAGSVLNWQGVDFKVNHVRGHANHHLTLLEPITKTLFTGDSFGCAYPIVNRKRGCRVIVSTSPTDFDGPAALAVVDAIEKLAQIGEVDRIALTHFGFLERHQISAAADQLRQQLHMSVAMVYRIQRENLTVDRVAEHLKDWWLQIHQNQGIQLDLEDLRAFSIDLKVNAQGLHWAANKIQTK